MFGKFTATKLVRSNFQNITLIWSLCIKHIVTLKSCSASAVCSLSYSSSHWTNSRAALSCSGEEAHVQCNTFLQCRLVNNSFHHSTRWHISLANLQPAYDPTVDLRELKCVWHCSKAWISNLRLQGPFCTMSTSPWKSITLGCQNRKKGFYLFFYIKVLQYSGNAVASGSLFSQKVWFSLTNRSQGRYF